MSPRYLCVFKKPTRFLKADFVLDMISISIQISDSPTALQSFGRFGARNGMRHTKNTTLENQNGRQFKIYDAVLGIHPGKNYAERGYRNLNELFATFKSELTFSNLNKSVN